MTPEGAQKVAIYTDEHGIGDVNFRPGSGFWFDSLLATQPDLDSNLNGGCDLKYLKDSVLGHAEHHRRVPLPEPAGLRRQPVGSATITKTVKSLFAKYLAVYPKGTTAELRNARIVIAHAQDIDGSPFANEVVCFSNTSASGIDAGVPARSTEQPGRSRSGRTASRGMTRVDDPNNSQSDKRVCIRTNQYGNAAIEVLESQGAEINIIGDFTAERLLRDVKVPFGEGTPSRRSIRGSGRVRRARPPTRPQARRPPTPRQHARRRPRRWQHWPRATSRCRVLA